MVEEGDLIATLDFLAELQRENRLNEIALRRVEIAVERAQLMLDETLLRNPNNTAEIQSKEWDLELAQLNFEELSIRVGVQQASLDGAMLVAPASGMIIDMNIRMEKVVEAQAMAVVIADITKTSILVDSYAVDIEELSEGMSVTMRLTNNPGETYTGTIQQMPYPYGTGPGRDTNKNIYISVDDPKAKEEFQIGDKFTIEAIVATAENVLWLPPQAIREFGGRTFVMVQDGELQRSIDVVKGLTNGEMTEILEGLEEGLIVVGQ
jgi:multidrug efflux pump subunit AcrA (membrane-fusion protein)